MNIQQLTERWIEHCCSGWRETTASRARSGLDDLLCYVGPKLRLSGGELRRGLIVSYVQDLAQRLPRSAYKTWATVRAFLRWCHQMGYFAEDLANGVRPPRKPRQEPKPLISESEFRLLVERSDDPEKRLMLVLAWHTGMSLIDCMTIKWCHIDLEHQMIRKPRQKTGIMSTIKFEPGGELHNLLVEQHGRMYTGDQYDSVMPTLAKQNPPSMHLWFRRLLARCGITRKLTIHSFRSTMISQLVNSGANMAVAMRVVGHTGVEQFSAYATVSEEAIDQALSFRREGKRLTVGQEIVV